MTAQRVVSTDEGRSGSINFALLRFLEQNPGIETALDFVNHCRARGGESHFQSRCVELGLDPNELCTSRTTEMSEWVWGDSYGLDDPPRLVAVG
jgi:hypothetical protein